VTRAGEGLGGLTTQEFGNSPRLPAQQDELPNTRSIDKFRHEGQVSGSQIRGTRLGDPRLGDLRQRLPAAERRNQLLDVALEKFAASGFHGTSMEEIADAAGVTKPVLYQHFPSKRKLYLELLDMVGTDLLEMLTRSAEAEKQPFQRVLAGFRVYFRFVGENTSAFQLLFGSGDRRTDEFSDYVATLEESIAATIGKFIDADIDQGHRDLLGYAIVGLAEVAGRRWVAQNTQEPGSLNQSDGERLAIRLADLVWAGLRGLPGGAAREGAVI
jgi:AcrR family transcriptional regulator